MSDLSNKNSSENEGSSNTSEPTKKPETNGNNTTTDPQASKDQDKMEIERSSNDVSNSKEQDLKSSSNTLSDQNQPETQKSISNETSEKNTYQPNNSSENEGSSNTSEPTKKPETNGNNTTTDPQASKDQDKMEIEHSSNDVSNSKEQVLPQDLKSSSNTLSDQNQPETQKSISNKTSKKNTYQPNNSSSNNTSNLINQNDPKETWTQQNFEIITSEKIWIQSKSNIPTGNEHPSRFKIVTYNLLADSYAHFERYSYCKKQFLRWNYRKDYIISQLLSFNAEIICLQEVDEKMIYDIEPRMNKSGYNMIFLQKFDKPDGCVIFFRRFKKINSHMLIYDSSFETPKSENAGVSLSPCFLKSNSVAIILELELNEKKICVATTHLTGNPSASDIRLLEIQKLLSKMEEYQEIPVLLCGDFNSDPQTKLYEFICSGNSKDQSKLTSHNFKFKSFNFETEKKEPNFTFYTDSIQKTMDYIFYSTSSNKTELVPLKVDKLTFLEPSCYIPNEKHPSDHFPLVADFKLEYKKNLHS